jgi:hypothetical protein
VTIQAAVFEAYAVSRHPGTKADMDTSCEDYLHSSSIELAATPRRKRAAKANSNHTQTAAQQQQDQEQASSNPVNNPPAAQRVTFSPAPNATSMSPAAQQPVAQKVPIITMGPTTQSTAGTELSPTDSPNETKSFTQGRKLLEGYSSGPRDDLNNDDDDDGDDKVAGLDAVLAGDRRRHGRSGYFGGRAIIFTGHITSVTGPLHSHLFRGGLVEHVSRFSQALPLSKAEYGLLPTDVPEVVPGSYKYVLYKRL